MIHYRVQALSRPRYSKEVTQRCHLKWCMQYFHIYRIFVVSVTAEVSPLRNRFAFGILVAWLFGRLHGEWLIVMCCRLHVESLATTCCPRVANVCPERTLAKRPSTWGKVKSCFLCVALLMMCVLLWVLTWGIAAAILWMITYVCLDRLLVLTRCDAIDACPEQMLAKWSRGSSSSSSGGGGGGSSSSSCCCTRSRSTGTCLSRAWCA